MFRECKTREMILEQVKRGNVGRPVAVKIGRCLGIISNFQPSQRRKWKRKGRHRVGRGATRSVSSRRRDIHDGNK